jgi:uncharacterized membrane protein
MGENHFAGWLVALYGVDLLMCAVGFTILTMTLIHHHEKNSLLAQAIGSDFKGKICFLIYILGIALAFLELQISLALYVLVAIIC